MRRHPEITEEENHRGQNRVVQPAGRKHVRDRLRGPAFLEGDAHDRRGEKQKRPGENDRHHARVIHLQRHVLRLAAVHFSANDALGVLHRDLAHALRHRDDGRDHDKEKCHHDDENGGVDLARSGFRGRHKGLPRLCERRGETRHDTDRDDERDAVANAALRDLIAEPHQK